MKKYDPAIPNSKPYIGYAPNNLYATLSNSSNHTDIQQELAIEKEHWLPTPKV